MYTRKNYLFIAYSMHLLTRAPIGGNRKNASFCTLARIIRTYSYSYINVLVLVIIRSSNNFNEIVIEILLTVSNYASPFYSTARIRKRQNERKKKRQKKKKRIKRSRYLKFDEEKSDPDSFGIRIVLAKLAYSLVLGDFFVFSFFLFLVFSFFPRRNETKDWKSHLKSKNSDHFYRIRVN